MHKASTISDYLIAFSHEHGDPLSNLKLQKLLYYAQAWHLAIFDQPLFGEPIEAWVHGPVVVAEYHRFKGWAWQPIQDDPKLPKLDEAVEQHLNEVMEVYGGMTAYQLEQLTHSEAPWVTARNGIPEDEPSNAVISNELMKEFYRALLDG
ncbi:MAG TPA: type II toxin-antitoxin system antitoxin SocA domain-containing protein [Candidatus Acidoferrum sp.]|jgi:uncharacterized phage-associated protein|nr:type II toxin-antitoxin system antitoxin SocA domain-containing protein [Candidatus Acidoferrum sp.]